MTRYHPLLVALHWVLAVMITMALVAGGVVLENMPNSDPAKIDALRAHMTVGLAIGALLVVRLATRLTTAHPPAATTGAAVLDRIGALTHWLFYLLIAVVVASGMATSAAAGLPAIVFEGSGDPLPESFFAFTARYVHGYATGALMALILLHIAAAAYHQLVLRDGLLRRMWFGRRR